jgi:hypothetical protein
MNYLILLASLFLPARALADPPAPTVLQSQYLAAIEYAKGGGPTGCGLRATGETGTGLWVDVLLNVFAREPGEMFGMFKVVVRKINLRDGAPVLQDGRITYSSIGKIYKARMKTGSGTKTAIREGLDSPHNDGYMARLEFDNAIALLAEMPQSGFRVAYSTASNGPEEAIEFNRRITSGEARKLSACMNKLRGASGNRSDKTL